MVLLGVGGALAVVFTTAAPATACSCVMGDQADFFEWSDTVFTGEVVDRGSDDSRISYRFDVDRVYEGDAADDAVVTSGRQSSMCGMPDLEVGTAYVVYATAEDGRLSTGLCSGTRKALPAFVERVEWYAGSGHPPGAATSGDDPAAAALPEESGIAERPLALALVGGGAAVVIAGGLLLGRRRFR